MAKRRSSSKRASQRRTVRDRRKSAARIVPDVFVVPNKSPNRRAAAPVDLKTGSSCKDALKRPCPIQLVFEGRSAFLRLCRGKDNESAVKIAVKSPVEALQRAQNICGCMEAGGSATSCAAGGSRSRGR